MIKTYNPKEIEKWIEYSSLVIGIILIIGGILNNRVIISILGLFFILLISNKRNIFIDQEGLLINTTTFYWIKRTERLNFKKMDSLEVKKGKDRSLVVFWKGYRGRRVLISTNDLDTLFDYIRKENPDLIRLD